ncbi:tRNA-queuosine alpha-mannosyltransferase domain-containing protein [Desulfobacterota bacterium M19]
MGKTVVIEPYYGGSHKAFIDGLIKNLPGRFTLYTLPARKWKWRMRLAAPCFAAQVQSGKLELSDADRILCSPFLDVAAFRGLLPPAFRDLPIYTYFHENQFAYPVQINDKRDFHFALTNFTTALASNLLAFNSRYNFSSFIEGCRGLLRKMPDMALPGWEDTLRARTTILYPPLDFREIDEVSGNLNKNPKPLILWNHRWEHDKNPELFFAALFALQREGLPFKLIVAGESFPRQPKIFTEARIKLADHIEQFGYVESRQEYIALLSRADLVVSTARHEFYGIAVLEAVRAGCRPLLPNSLSYPELFPLDFLYEKDKLLSRLRGYLTGEAPMINGRKLTNKFSWPALREDYCRWLSL